MTGHVMTGHVMTGYVMTGHVLIYGATGYTGKLIARMARGQGLEPVLAGRNAEKLKTLAGPLNLSWRAFDLTDPAQVDAALGDVAVVLCIAGPFSATSRPMADVCIRRRVHYLDITGEIGVFEALAGRDQEARQAGVMLLPGVGFDVVPSDCLAAMLKQRLPDAVELEIHLQAGSAVSRGTARTVIQEIAAGPRERRGGRLVTLDRPGRGWCDFGQGARPTVQIPWGDVSTAYHSTGIPNIAVYAEDVSPLQVATRLAGPARSLLRSDFMQGLLRAMIERRQEGPGEAARRAGRCVMVGLARTGKGERARLRLRTPEPYTLTAMTALDSASRVASGIVQPGFQTPSRMFGADYILGFAGVTREVLDA